MTYSIVGRDEANGELGVAVQSRAFGVGFCAWALLIRGVHQRLESGPRRTKGAAELLDIGALPVT